MKITKEGKLPEPPKPTFAGKTASCLKCGARVELEARDKPARVSNAKADPGPKFKCPTTDCKGELSLQK